MLLHANIHLTVVQFFHFQISTLKIIMHLVINFKLIIIRSQLPFKIRINFSIVSSLVSTVIFFEIVK